MIRIGMIGAGRIGRVHARAVAAHPSAVLTMVAAPSYVSAEELVRVYGGVATRDASEVFASDEVDAVVIASPTTLHADHVVAAAAAGKPALCEKPIAMDSASVVELKSRLANQGTPDPMVMVGFNRRFDPSFNAVYEAVRAGEIGDLEQLTIVSRDPAPPSKAFIATSGGLFKDMTVHDIDMARRFLGEIKQVYAVGQNLDPNLLDTGDFDGAVVTLTNAEGRTATITTSRHSAAGYDQRLEAFGSKGSLQIENMRPTTVLRSSSRGTDMKDTYLGFFLERYEKAFALEFAAFVEAIEAGVQPVPGIEDGVKALQIAEAVEESARTHKVVFC